MAEIFQLALADVVAGRPFTDPAAGAEDLRVLRRMVARLRELIVNPEDDPTGNKIQYLERHDQDGSVHRLVLPDWPALTRPADVTAVGFFGQIRPHVDHTPIMDLENELIEQLPATAGLLTYYNMHVPNQGYGNLVLFGSERAKEGWRDNEKHGLAVRLTPQHYYSVRLHNGVIAGGIVAGEALVLTRTKYFDFQGAEPWRALRSYS